MVAFPACPRVRGHLGRHLLREGTGLRCALLTDEKSAAHNERFLCLLNQTARATVIQVRPIGLPQSSSAWGGASPSRMRPPAHAANHEEAAPSSAAAPAVKAITTALLRAREIFSFARAATSSTRRSASGCASPVAVAASRTR